MTMATIQTAIRLNDMMTTPIRHILNAMDGLLSSWNDLDAATASGLNVGGIQRTRAELALAQNSLDQLDKKQDEFNRSVNDGANAMDGLTGKIMGAVGAYASLQGLKQLVNLSDTFTQTNARLSMIVDKGSDVEELFDKITASANRSRASISSTADAVAKLALSAPKTFASNDETILFVETLNKMFAIAGINQESMASATLQLTQAMGSGVLRGEEFNAVYEAAPQIMHKVAESMGIPIEQLRDMAQEGKVTANVVKNALLGAAEDVDKEFQNMPMTWAQVWADIMNGLYYASIPLLEAINWMAQNWSILEPIVLGLATAVGLYTAALLVHNAIQWASNAAKTIGIIKAVAHGAAITAEMTATTGMTAAQLGFNAALYACPLTWILLIIIAVIAAIYAVVAAINKVTNSTISATGVIAGAVTTVLAYIWNMFVAWIDLILGGISTMANGWIAFVNFFANLFNDPIASVIHLFGDMADAVLGMVESIAKALDKVFGSNLAKSVQGWRSGLNSMVEAAANKYGNGSYEKVVDELNLSAATLGLERWAYTDAYKTGYDWGAGVEEEVGKFFGGNLTDEDSMEDLLEGVRGNTEDIANNTDDALDITNENLKYLRDLAEQDAVNRFTTAEIRVEMGGVNNTVNQNTDLDGVVDYMVTGIHEAMERVAEGVHN